MKLYTSAISSTLGFLSLGRGGCLRSHLRQKRQAKFETYALEKRHASNAKFIAVTGSSGKSTTTALISHLLATRHKVRPQVLDNLYNGLLGTLAELENDDEFVVAETAVAKPGDMTPQAAALSPDVSVVTMLGLEHKVSFKTLENIAKEKSQLVEATKNSGITVLNIDDPLAWEMRNLAKCKIVSFGSSVAADYQVVSVDYRLGKNLSLNMRFCNHDYRFEVPLNGVHFWVSVAAAISVAHELGLSPIEIFESLLTFKPVFGRCTTYKPTHGPLFVLDTAKAPHYSLSYFFDLIQPNRQGKTIVVLGQVSDYGQKNNSVYGAIYRAVKDIADVVVFVGEHSQRSGATAADISNGKFKAFEHVVDACSFIRAISSSDDLIYIKSSQNLHLERIAMSYDVAMKCDLDICGSPINCQKCGLIEFHPESHLEQKYVRGELRRPWWKRLKSRLLFRINRRELT